MKNVYLKRVVDSEIKRKLNVFGSLYIEGPKWCGKTTTGMHFAKSYIQLQANFDNESLLESARINPAPFLNGDKPKLIDEWQDAPAIWDAVRNYCDNNTGYGHFILTGSTSKKVNTRHTGTGRIATIKMQPMSLYESGESNGSISLKEIFDGKEQLLNGCVSKIELSDLIFAACRGGWPNALFVKNKEDQLLIAKNYFNDIYRRDMFNIDNVKRNPKIMESILKSYARNISTLAKTTSILSDISSNNEQISIITLNDYLSILEQLFIIQDIDGWCPSIRSRENMRNGKKREFIDPSIATAALGLTPKSLEMDLKTFGFIFETMCIRDLRVYSNALNGEISYYHDRFGLEADAVLHLDDGRYALIEFKLGNHNIEEGANHLNKLESLIIEHNEQNKKHQLKLPSIKMVITGSKYGYKRPDGIFVIPLGCLKD